MSNLAFTRMKTLQQMLRKNEVDAYVTLCPLEQRYVSGVELSQGEGVLLVTPRQSYFFTKQLIAPKIKAACDCIQVQVVPFGTMVKGALDFIKHQKLKNVYFDPSLVDFTTGAQLAKTGCKPLASLIGQMRLKKDADEVAKLKKACRIAAQAFEEVKPQIKTGMTEDEVRVLMALALIQRGADSIPFNIVCFGENTADAHHTPSKTRKLKAQEAVLMDFGCFYEGYTSDMTRSWWHGNKEPAEYTRIWKIVDKARTAGVKKLRAGVTAHEVDQAARQVIEAAGYGKEFFHTTGHGIGLEVHDQPILRTADKTPLQADFVVTVEPGIYFDGRWGIRLEDSFLVTQTGCKKLTHK